MRKLLWTLLALLPLPLAGCSPDVDAAEVRRSIEEAVDDLRAFSADMKDEFLDLAEKNGAKIEEEIRELRKKLEENEDLRRELDEKSREVKRLLEEARREGAEAWEETREALIEAYEELQEAVEEVKRELH